MTDNLLADQGEPTPPKSYLDTLTGPGGKFDKTKYKSDGELLEALARGKWEADNFINTKNKAFDDLSADYVRLKEEVDKGPKIQELLDQMTQKLSSEQTQANNVSNQQPAYDPKQVESLIAESLQRHELTKVQQQNQNTVKEKLLERYGNNYPSLVKQQIEDLGVSEDLFNNLAKNNPKLLIRTLGLDQEPQQDIFQAPPRSSVKADSFTPRGGQKRTWSYYQELKKTQPRLYSDPKTQMQMHNDYMALGSSFEDGDFHSR